MEDQKHLGSPAPNEKNGKKIGNDGIVVNIRKFFERKREEVEIKR
jgi:hypothetical protein